MGREEIVPSFVVVLQAQRLPIGMNDLPFNMNGLCDGSKAACRFSAKPMSNARRIASAAGTVLAWLLILLPATSRGQSDAQAQDRGAGPDGGALGDAQEAHSSVRVQIGGSILPRETVHEAVGAAPSDDADDATLAEWAAAACRRIVAVYHAADYDYARAWFSLEENKLIWIYVDPGRMRVSFVGVGGVGAALFRLSLNLPSNVFHKPTVERALQELKEKYGLVNITYQVRDLGESQITPFGPMVPDRLLQIYVVSREFLGWSLDVSVSAAWGVVPAVSYHRAGLLLDDDRLFTRVEFAFPYRRYLTEEEPRLRWVHGGFDAAYRLPRRLQGLLALRLETSLYLSQFDRPDLAITTYDFLRSTTVPALVFIRPYLEVSLGAGADVVSIFQVQRDSASATDNAALGDLKSVRALFRLVVNLDPRALVMQRDQRPWLHLQVDTATSNIQKWLVDDHVDGPGGAEHRTTPLHRPWPRRPAGGRCALLGRDAIGRRLPTRILRQQILGSAGSPTRNCVPHAPMARWVRTRRFSRHLAVHGPQPVAPSHHSRRCLWAQRAPSFARYLRARYLRRLRLLARGLRPDHHFRTADDLLAHLSNVSATHARHRTRTDESPTDGRQWPRPPLATRPDRTYFLSISRLFLVDGGTGLLDLRS